jgi:3-hydroxybutyryl-CoA dehydrogenase
MTVDPASPDYCIGIIGAGTMGRGIAQIAVGGGIKIKLYDGFEGAARSGHEFVSRMVNRSAEKGNITQEDAAAAIARLEIVDSLEGLAGVNLVIEAVIEDLDIKKDLFGKLEKIVAPDCILASNTSSLSVTAIAAGCDKPGRVAGYHFFNPVPLLKVVEVIAGVLTDGWVSDALDKVARRCGHEPVRTQDSPGFLVNHAGRGFYTEGLRIAQEGIASFSDIDDVLRDGAAGFRMGPFELMDTTGLDVSGVVMESIYQQFYEEPRFRPVAFTRQRMAAGLFGRKSGRGYYVYEDNKKIAPDPKPVPDARPSSVWIDPAVPDGRASLVALLKDRIEIDNGAKPGARSVCIVTPLGKDATTAALEAGIEAERTVAIDTLLGLDKRRTLMTTPVTDPDLRDQVHGLLASDGVPVTVIHDSPGFIAQRVIAAIVNIGCEIAQQGIATSDDINKAVRLGLNYPKGPIEFGDSVGPARILTILQGLHDAYLDPRYRPSVWLSRRARLGVTLDTPEG